MIHIRLWENVSWVIKKTEEMPDPQKWEKIKVKVIHISKSADNEKIHIELKQVA
jgi:hypothetical protein